MTKKSEAMFLHHVLVNNNDTSTASLYCIATYIFCYNWSSLQSPESPDIISC